MFYERLVLLSSNLRKDDRLLDVGTQEYRTLLTDAYDVDGTVEFTTWHDHQPEFMALPYGMYCTVLRLFGHNCQC